MWKALTDHVRYATTEGVIFAIICLFMFIVLPTLAIIFVGITKIIEAIKA